MNQEIIRFLEATKFEGGPLTDPKDYPESWKRILYKSYPRFEQVPLPEPSTPSTTLVSCLRKRRSVVEFSGRPLSLQELSAVLRLSTAPSSNELRPYPSAGARYPLEIYFVSFSPGEISAGLYHYSLKEHALEVLLTGPMHNHYEKCASSMTSGAAGAMVVTADLGRSEPKYGATALRYALMEAGHLAQNILLSGAAIDLEMRPIGGFEDAAVSELFDLPKGEVPLYVIAVAGAPPGRP